eukprot:SAG31_NODE_30_length_32545_cov_9.378999_28_plen_597_part_00
MMESVERDLGAPQSDDGDVAVLNRRARRLTKRQRLRNEENSNAAVCPFWFEKLDKRLTSNADGATPYRWAIRIVSIVFALNNIICTHQAGILTGILTAQNGILLMWFVTWSCGLPLISIPLLNYLARVIRPDQHLRAMGAGRVKLSQRAVDHLNKWRVRMRVARAVFALIGGLFFMMGFIMLSAGTFYGVPIWAVMCFSMGLTLALAFNHVCDWWLTLMVASALAADATLEVVLAAQEVSPKSDDWVSRVVEPSTKLALDVMDELTHGWGSALFVMFAASWLTAVGSFAMALMMSTATGFFLVFFYGMMSLTVLFVCVPIAMSRDPAGVSTSCDELLAELNARRCELLGQDELIGKIRDLEDYLDRLNNQQGIGFAVNETALDKPRIRNMMVGVFGIFSTVVPFIITLYSTAMDGTPVYGMMVNSTRVYAYTEKVMSYDQGVNFCESIWMKPVSIHSQTESDAMIELTGAQNGIQFYVGASRCADTIDRSPNFRWDDGTPWDFTNPGNDVVPTGYRMTGAAETKYRMVVMHENDETVWQDAQNDHGIICAAASLSEIKSDTPTIRRLGGPETTKYRKQVVAGGVPRLPAQCPAGSN